MVGRYRAATKTTIDGFTFDSKKEAKRYTELKLLEAGGVIERLELQPRFDIVIGGIPVKMRSARYPNGRQLKYVGDFKYFDTQLGRQVIEDVKGHRTEVYKLKKALMEAMGHTITEI